MKKAAIIALSTLLLTACAAGSSRTAPLPDVIGYSKKLQSTAADEMVGGTCPTLNTLTIDYGVMREQTRIAKKGR